MNTNIAYFSESQDVSYARVQDVVAAIDVATKRDLKRWWGRAGETIAVRDKTQVPFGYAPGAIQDDIGQPGAGGFHTDENGQPQIFILVANGWETAADHEAKEARIDPSGNRLIPCILRGENILLLCEVCDPCEEETYMVNGIEMSNFYKPEYFDPQDTPNFAYDHLYKHDSPMFMAPGGYISYQKSDGSWYQDTWFDGSAPVTRGPMTFTKSYPHQSLRSMVDEYMRREKLLKSK